MSLSLRRHTHCVIVICPQHPTISMQLLCKCLNNNAVNTLWNTPYYIIFCNYYYLISIILFLMIVYMYYGLLPEIKLSYLILSYICTNIIKSIKIVCVWGGGGGKAQKFILQHMSIVYYNYNFVQTLVLFQTKSSEMGHNFTALIDPFN